VGQRGHPFEDDYLAFVQDTFGATLEEVPLGAQATADEIDEWVAERTEGLIEEIAEDLGLPTRRRCWCCSTPCTSWGVDDQFDPDETRDAPFTLADGSEVEVPTMHRRRPGAEVAAA
jgi:serine protease inhibitor